jgi:ribosomal protein L7/L12
MAPEAGDFNLIIVEVESGRIPEAVKAFSKAFSLDEGIATKICSGAPINFAQKLTKQEVKAITPVLGELSKTGIEFRITARLPEKLPKVNWPVRPQFTAGGAPAVSGLAFEWDNNAFVCPGCGESFLFRRMGKVKLVEPPMAVGHNGAEVAAAAAAPAVAARATQSVKASVSSGNSELGSYEEAMRPAPRAVGVEGVSQLAGEGESLDLPETMDELKGSDEPLAEGMLQDAEPMPAPEPLEEVSGTDGGFGESAEPALAETEPEPVAAPPAEPEPAPVAEEEAPAGDPGELYNVFLSKITDTSKRDKAAELISKVKGCSTPEAKELTTRLVIPLAKNVSKNKAEDILNQFKKLKIFGRMTKVK